MMPYLLIHFTVNTRKHLVFLIPPIVKSNSQSVLTRIYGANRIEAHNYGTIVRSLTFAGTIFGMVTFGTDNILHLSEKNLYRVWLGWLSDKIGRKFGMVRRRVQISIPFPDL